MEGKLIAVDLELFQVSCRGQYKKCIVSEIGWAVSEWDGSDERQKCYLVRHPELREFLDCPAHIVSNMVPSNGITVSDCLHDGVELQAVLQELQNDLDEASLVMAHNYSVEQRGLYEAFTTCEMPVPKAFGATYKIMRLMDVPQETLKHQYIFDTCHSLATKSAALHHNTSKKLRDLYAAMVDPDMQQTHRAGDDAMMCLRLYKSLREMRKPKPPPPHMMYQRRTPSPPAPSRVCLRQRIHTHLGQSPAWSARFCI